MQQRTSRVIVQGLAASIWILTFIITVVTLNSLARWQFFTLQGATLLSHTTLFIGFVNLLLVIAFGTAIGWGLWHRYKWGRILAMVFILLIMADVIVHLFWMTLTIGWLLLLVACLSLLYLLGMRDDVKALFR